MYLKFFLPFLLLALLQVTAFYIYNGFSYIPSDKNQIFITIMYIFSIFAVIAYCLFNNKSKKIEQNDKRNKYIELLFLIITIVLVLKPTFIMFSMGMEYGFDYVRQNFFSSDIIRAHAFGNMTLAIFTQFYVVPVLWFYIIYLMGCNNKKTTFTFYFILFSLIAFNLSYAGRFYIYFALLILYLKNLIEGRSILDFLRKNIILILSLFTVSTLVVALRNNRQGLANESSDMLRLLEYHILQPFFLAQKMDHNELIYDGYPFRVIIEGFFAPVLYFFEITFKDLPQGKYSRIFDSSTLYSVYSDSYYNAFATFFPYIYIDFGYLSPLFSFIIIIFFLMYSKIILDNGLRTKYIAYIALTLYFSLFQSTLFSYGTISILILFPLLNYLFFRPKKN
ncbi:O-antigen polymerase [Acinetobacter sp. YH01009]|uniref:O-antigen polymerase n=1 Tax=Acinetobacter sp. YH01009 TaxID=2601025 RepID=UPI0015D3F78A|nr:O-antigen polymerase [Acinetobacter sp. YH01009]